MISVITNYLTCYYVYAKPQTV